MAEPTPSRPTRATSHERPRAIPSGLSLRRRLYAPGCAPDPETESPSDPGVFDDPTLDVHAPTAAAPRAGTGRARVVPDLVVLGVLGGSAAVAGLIALLALGAAAWLTTRIDVVEIAAGPDAPDPSP